MVVAGLVAGVVVVVATAVVIGRVNFQRRISAEVGELLARGKGIPRTALIEADHALLPEPVRRWLRYSQVVGKERPAIVRLKQTGQFRLGEDRSWMPFTAEQYYTTDPPGFGRRHSKWRPCCSLQARTGTPMAWAAATCGSCT